MNIHIKTYLWIFPFFSFALGYMAMQQLFHMPDVTTPHLVGKQVHEILPLVTQNKLNLRLMDQKEEADLPEGVILNQDPQSGTPIKPHQPLFIVTTKKPAALRAPACVGMHIDQLLQHLQSAGIHPRIHYLPHPYPEKICFTQSPQTGESLEKNRLIVYISAGNNKPVIWPDFTQLPLQEVVDFLDNYGIQPDIINSAQHTKHTHGELIVIDQRPFAGTLLTLDNKKPLSVQLRVH